MANKDAREGRKPEDATTAAPGPTSEGSGAPYGDLARLIRELAQQGGFPIALSATRLPTVDTGARLRQRLRRTIAFPPCADTLLGLVRTADADEVAADFRDYFTFAQHPTFGQFVNAAGATEDLATQLGATLDPALVHLRSVGAATGAGAGHVVARRLLRVRPVRHAGRHAQHRRHEARHQAPVHRRPRLAVLHGAARAVPDSRRGPRRLRLQRTPAHLQRCARSQRCTRRRDGAGAGGDGAADEERPVLHRARPGRCVSHQPRVDVGGRPQAGRRHAGEHRVHIAVPQVHLPLARVLQGPAAGGRHPGNRCRHHAAVGGDADHAQRHHRGAEEPFRGVRLRAQRRQHARRAGMGRGGHDHRPGTAHDDRASPKPSASPTSTSRRRTTCSS